jgi:membrane-bound PQQ-dependent dehydrogenase (glucose/quinate/shikimate family)
MRAIVHWGFALVIGLVGLLLSLGGGYLTYLGGSPYYLLIGLATLLTAWWLIRRNGTAVLAYGAALAVSVAWSLFESGFDFFALLPRLALWLGLGVYFLTPWYRASLGSEPEAASPQPPNRWWIGGPSLAGVALLAASTLTGYVHNGTGTLSETQADIGTDWRHYGNTPGGTRFAAIEQINTESVSGLEEVWRYRTGLEEDFKATPLAIGDTLYLCGAGNVMIALDAESGEERWRFDPDLPRVSSHQYAITCRGVTYHEADDGYTGECPARIVTATVAASLIAVDAKTGALCEQFGDGGTVDLRNGISSHQPDEYYHTSPPTLAGDNLVVGGLVLDSQDLGLPSGVVRAFDAITGELSWAWDVGNPENRGAPAPGETYTPGTPNVWSVMSYDPEFDLVFAPTGNANPDYFGGVRRPFDDEFSSAIVAIDGSTGETRWTFQTVHHDIWDFDVPAQPVSVDLTKDGKRVPALAVPTKMGQIFLLDRRDGSPVAPIEERPVPQSPELGEYLSPTQPFSSLPNFHPFRHERDMWGLTPIDQLVCRIDYRRMRYDGMYTPPTKGGSLVAPGNFGGFNWGSVSVDADNGLLVAAPMLLAHRLLLVTPEQVADAGPQAALLLGDNHPAVQMDPDQPPPAGDPEDPFNHDQILYYGLPMPFMSILGTGIPCFEPPWSQLAVIDLNTSELLWSRPVGDMSDAGPFNLRSGLPIDVGTAVRAGTLTTRGGLTFISSTMDSTVRAYDVRTGEEKWEHELPGNGQATPMSYVSEQSGKQFLIVTVPNPSWRYPRDPVSNDYIDSQSIRDGRGGYVIAYALPDRQEDQ